MVVPTNNGNEEDRMCEARRCGVRGDIVLQAGLALLGVVLSALVWLFLVDGLAPGG